jgi:hypothetical protein
MLDLLTGGRVFGLASSAASARDIERIVHLGEPAAQGPGAPDGSSSPIRLVAPPAQMLLPVLVLCDGALTHPLLAIGASGAGWRLITASVQDLVALSGVDALTAAVREARRAPLAPSSR